MKVVHVTTGLELGGAEMVLTRLIEGTAGVLDSTVVSLSGRGHLADRIERAGVEVISTEDGSMRSPLELGRVVRRLDADVVQTWMYHADLLGGTAAWLARAGTVVWGLHAGVLSGWKSTAALTTGAALSRVVPARIVCCSETSRVVHAGRGYDARKMVVVDNGFVVPELDASARSSVREELGLPDDAVLVGRPGRFHPQKDYPTLVAAFSRVLEHQPGAVLLLTGPRIDDGNAELRALVAGLQAGSVRLLGRRDDLVRLNQACDVVVSSSSFGEALPLVIGEAMSVGTPVVATDVGDSARVVDDTGWVVPIGSPKALGDALVQCLALDPVERRARGAAARLRIEASFGLERMCQGYVDVYRSVAA